MRFAAARRVLDRQPDAVPELLGAVEESSREAIGELHRMLGVLRRDEADSVGAGSRPGGGEDRPVQAVVYAYESGLARPGGSTS